MLTQRLQFYLKERARNLAARRQRRAFPAQACEIAPALIMRKDIVAAKMEKL
jgi:hypothetical protein